MDEDINIFNAIAIADPLTAQAMAKARRVAEEGDMADARYPQTSHGAELALVIECSRGGKGNTAGDVRRVRKLRALQGEVNGCYYPAHNHPKIPKSPPAPGCCSSRCVLKQLHPSLVVVVMVQHSDSPFPLRFLWEALRPRSRLPPRCL